MSDIKETDKFIVSDVKETDKLNIIHRDSVIYNCKVD